MEKSGFAIASDVRKEGHEKSEFPILCEICLGDNPYVRMTRQHSGKECKICTRPYTVFRWKPGPVARFKQTIICQTCAKLKNVCQACLFDLEYGLPVQVRDKFIMEANSVGAAGGGLEGKVSSCNSNIATTDLSSLSNVNRNYLANQLEKSNSSAYNSSFYSGSNNHAAQNPHLLHLARSSPYYKRNAPRVCSFWLKGLCTRGAACPYAHAHETHDPFLASQNIKDRYAGVDDPLANKLLRVHETLAFTLKTQPPDNKDITSLFLKNIDTYRVTEDDLRDEFYAFGEIKSIKINQNNNTAFVNFVSRASAENAMVALHSNLAIKGCRISVSWANPKKAAENFSDSQKFSLTSDEEQTNLRLRASKNSAFSDNIYASMNPFEAEHRR